MTTYLLIALLICLRHQTQNNLTEQRRHPLPKSPALTKQPSVPLNNIFKHVLHHTLEIGLLRGQKTDLSLELVARLATRTPQNVGDRLLLHDLPLQTDDLLSEDFVVGFDGGGAFQLKLHHPVVVVDGFFLGGEGELGADELAVHLLGEDDQVRVVAWHDGVGVLDVGLLDVSLWSDQMLSLENLHCSPGECVHGVGRFPRWES
jgi:hypothetical protein